MMNKEKYSLQDLATRYDEWAENYPVLARLSNYQGSEWLQECVDYFQDEPAEVLDLGCADGFIASQLHAMRPGYVFDGLDFSRGMLNSAARTGLYRALAYADLSEGLPKDGLTRYDYITALAFLEYIENTDKLMHDILSVLKPDGLVFMTFQKTSPDLADTILGINYYSFADTGTMLRYLQDMGFAVIQISEGVGYWDANDGLPRDYFFVVAGKESMDSPV